ncbi:MAG: hypothetical protein ABFD50_13950 [Smithella sp.]
MLYLVVIPFVPPAAASCTENFFEDDFNRESLGSDWTKYGSYGEHAINNGVLELNPLPAYAYHARYAYTASNYTSDFIMEVSAKGEYRANFLIGISDLSTASSMQDIAHYIAFKRTEELDNFHVYLVYSNGGDDITLWSSSAGQFGTYSQSFLNFTLAKTGNYYKAWVNGTQVYSNYVSIDFANGEYQFSIDRYATYEYHTVTYIDYFYTVCNELELTAETTINMFAPNNIDNASIGLTSQIFRIFIGIAEAALKVGNIIVDNLIDAATTVIKIGQSALTIIAQASAQIYSGLITIISQISAYINSGLVAIIDKITVIVNSFNQIIDSIITILKTYYDEDTVYGTIIRVIPLILLLSIPTLVVYYKIGEFATIPMFMFMSIVAYATSLMPLWILIVALIGCIAILMQKRAKA